MIPSLDSQYIELVSALCEQDTQLTPTGCSLSVFTPRPLVVPDIKVAFPLLTTKFIPLSNVFDSLLYDLGSAQEPVAQQLLLPILHQPVSVEQVVVQIRQQVSPILLEQGSTRLQFHVSGSELDLCVQIPIVDVCLEVPYYLAYYGLLLLLLATHCDKIPRRLVLLCGQTILRQTHIHLFQTQQQHRRPTQRKPQVVVTARGKQLVEYKVKLLHYSSELPRIAYRAPL